MGKVTKVREVILFITSYLYRVYKTDVLGMMESKMLVWASVTKTPNTILNTTRSHYMRIFILDACRYYTPFATRNYYRYKIYVKIKDIHVLTKNFIEWHRSFSHKEIPKRFIDVLLNHFFFIRDNKHIFLCMLQ